MSKQKKRNIFHWFIKVILFLIPSYLLVIVGFYYSFKLFKNYNQDTIYISNAAFAIIAVLATVSFAFAGSLDRSSNPDDKGWYKIMLNAGERFFLASITLVIASIWKYTILDLKDIDLWFNSINYTAFIRELIQIILGGLFSFSLLSACLGIITVVEVLVERFVERMSIHK